MADESAPNAADELLAHAGFLARLAHDLTRDEHAAADLVQETYRIALERPPASGPSLRGWLGTVIGNAARNERRARTRRDERERRVARAEALAPEAEASERLEWQRALLEAVLVLPEEQRTVLYLRFFEEQKPAAIAARIGVPVATVKSRLTRALGSLRQRLDARGERRAWVVALAGFSTARAATVGSVLASGAGGLVMKKLAVAATGLLVLALAWSVSSGELLRRFERSRRPAFGTSEPLGTAPAPLAVALPPEALAGREPAPVQTVSTGALSARFSWSDGTPAVGIEIDASPENDPAPRREAKRATTDEGGRAHFEALFAGPVVLEPALRGRFEADVEPGATRTVAFTLPVGLDVEGRVVASDGTPVPGATVFGSGSGAWCPNERPLTTTGSDGSFQLRDVDAWGAIGARKLGYLPAVGFAAGELPASTSGARNVVLTLTPGGGRVAGRVLDPEGRPLGGARVLAGPRNGHQVEVDGLTGTAPDPAAVRTDEEGRFELVDALPLGRQPIFATAYGFPVLESEVEVVEGKPHWVELQLAPPARIEGRLLGLEGQPVAGVRVRVGAEDRGGVYWFPFDPLEAESDAEGWFRLDWVPPGAVELNAHDSDRPEIGRARARVECVAGATTTCELGLEPGLTIEGRLEDEAGAPLAGWTIASEAPFQRWWYPRRARTDAGGRFHLRNLGDTTHDLRVVAPGSFEQRTEVLGIAVGTRDLVIVVPDAHAQSGRVRGRVRDPSGRPLDDLRVTLWRDGVNAGHFVELDPATGVFEAEALPGSYHLDFGRGVRTLANVGGFAIEERGLTDLGELRLEALGRVEIEITGLAASQVERLRFRLDRRGSNSVELEAEGALLRSPELLAGDWTLTCGENELALDDPRVEVLAGTTTRWTRALGPSIRVPLRFENPGQHAFEVTVTDARGTVLFARRFLEPPPAQATLATRTFDVGLPPGPATLTLRTHAGREARLELSVTPELARGPALELRPR